jgi:hypothetical protein
MDHDPRGCPEKVTRRLLREIAVFRSWTLREVITALRAGQTVTCGWWRYHWFDEGDVR